MAIQYTLLWAFLFSGFCLSAQNGTESEISDRIEQGNFNPSTLLWYEKPATKWEEALPVGNGRLGAMVFGKPGEERIQLNEETYWSGGPYSTVVEGGHKVLPEIQKLVFEGEMQKAHKLFGRHLMGYPVEQQKYQSLANLHLFMENEEKVSDYKRWLDLETGITSVEYTAHGTTYRRDVYTSVPDQLVVIRITADKPASISLKAHLRGVRNQTHSNYGTDYFHMDRIGDDEARLTGKSADYLGVEGQLKYDARLKANSKGGTFLEDDEMLSIEGADEVTLYFAAATNFVNYKDVSADETKLVEAYLDAVKDKSYTQIRDAAVKDYKDLFERVSLSLPVTKNSYLPTEKRMANIMSAPDPQLLALSYQFGRYLLISSSRPGTEAANLQGIWNQDMNPSWDSKYTTNINLEMNYWAVESANLTECAEPLKTLISELTDQGAQVAREHYGAGGWVFHQNTDIWRVAAPMDGPAWGTFTVGGAWLTTHLWEHYLYTQDEAYLQEVYPIIKGSVVFFMDFLVKHRNGEWLVTNPSTSPENFPQSPGNQRFFEEITGSFRPGTTICAGSTIDMQILTDLFKYYVEASKILQKDSAFAEEVKEARDKLVPPLIGQDGGLQEWTDDWGQMEKDHRHFSHLYGLYPGNVISINRNPELKDAVVNVLEQRGDGGTGFSRGWKMTLWARLYDGNRANKIYKQYLQEQSYPQLFSMCFTPLQIDGTMGVTAGITEMLVQSHESALELLPALPDEWNTGSFQGVRLRGGFELNMDWKEGEVDHVEILSKKGKRCIIKMSDKTRVTSEGKNVKVKQRKDGTLAFDTLPEKVYVLDPF